MAQTTNTSIQEWEGTTDDVEVCLGVTSTVAAGQWSTSANTTLTEYDNTSTSPKRKWPMVRAKFVGTFASAPADDTFLEVYLTHDVDGTYTTPATTTLQKQSRYMGSIRLHNTATQRGACEFSLMGIKKCRFSIKNGTAQALNTGWTLTVEGIGLIPSS